MTVQTSSSFLAVLSAAVLLLVSGDAASAHKSSGPVINGPVHGQGSSHNPIVYRPVHGSGSTHNPIVYRPKPHPCSGSLRPGDCNPAKPPCRVGPHGECVPNY
jgi:hypothetical protein